MRALPRKLGRHNGADAAASRNQCHFVSRIHGCSLSFNEGGRG
jgi:hypothetical protein